MIVPGQKTRFSRIHEAARLFAWQETFAQTGSQDRNILWPILQRTVQSMPNASTVDTPSGRYVLFDPESSRWHFVLRVAADGFGLDSAHVVSFGDALFKRVGKPGL